jgi:hypothetical protein
MSCWGDCQEIKLAGFIYLIHILVLTIARLLKINNTQQKGSSLSLHSHMFIDLGAHVGLIQRELLGRFAYQKSSVFVVNFLTEQLYEDAPSCPGIADFTPA